MFRYIIITIGEFAFNSVGSQCLCSEFVNYDIPMFFRTIVRDGVALLHVNQSSVEIVQFLLPGA